MEATRESGNWAALPATIRETRVSPTALPKPRTAATATPRAAAGSSTQRTCWTLVKPMASAARLSAGSSCARRAWRIRVMVGRMSRLKVSTAASSENPLPAATHSRNRGTSRNTDTKPYITVGMLVIKWTKARTRRARKPRPSTCNKVQIPTASGRARSNARHAKVSDPTTMGRMPNCPPKGCHCREKTVASPWEVSSGRQK